MRSTHRRIDASTHRRIDASTRRNDSLVTTAFEHAPIGMALLSPQGAWLRVNEALCKLLGYSASELLATTFWKVTHPDDRDASLQQLRRLLAGEMNHYETETRYLRRSGAVMWGLLSVSLGRTAEGTPELFIVQIVDLTERNAAERREASLRSTESTKHGQPVEVSGVVQDITQRRKLEDTFRFLAQHSGASDGEGFFRPLARYLARALDAEYICVDRLVGDGRSAETLAAFRDGSFDDDLVYALEGTPCGVAIGQDVCVFPADVRERFPLDVALQALGAESYIGVTLRSAAGEPIGLIAVISRRPIVDVRMAESILRVVAVRAEGELEREQAVRRLSDSETRWRFALEGAGDALWDWDVPAGTVFFSKRHKQLLGYAEDELGDVFEEWRSRVHPEDLRRVIAELQTHLDNARSPYAAEYRLRCKDDSYKWIFARGLVTSRDAAGKPLRMVGTHTDVTARKQGEEALRISNQLLEASQSIAKVGGWELDLVTKKLFWTAETYRLHDTSPAEFNPTVDAGVGYFLPESRRVISAALEAAMERGEGYDLVLETLTTKGRRIDVRTTCEVTMHDGRPAKLTGIFQDIWEFDGQRGVFLLNDRIYALLGTTLAREGGYEMPAETFLREIGNAEEAAYLGEQIWMAVTAPRGGILQLECRLRRRDNGAVLHALVHYQLTTDAAGRGIRAFGSLLDITDRRQAELAREAREGQLQAVIGSAMDAILILDNEQRITLFNASAERIFGRTASEMLGQPLDILIPAPLRRRHQQHLSGVATSGSFQRDMGKESALVALRADGAEFPIEASISSVLAGDRLLFIAIVRDLTARKAAAAEREALQVQLQQSQKLDSIGQLAGGVAHDFNNMLSVILSTTELALEAVPMGGELHADLVEIRKAAERSAALTRQLLAFARQEAIAPRQLDLNETVAGMLTMLRRLLGEDLAMTWTPGVNLGHVKMDPSQVDQLLANLCINARDAVTGVGTVSIRTANATLDQAQLQGDAAPVSGAFVLLSVSDNGSGMDASTLGRIFAARRQRVPAAHAGELKPGARRRRDRAGGR